MKARWYARNNAVYVKSCNDLKTLDVSSRWQCEAIYIHTDDGSGISVKSNTSQCAHRQSAIFVTYMLIKRTIEKNSK